MVLRISCLSGRYRSHAQNLTPAALSFDVRPGKSFRNVKRRQQDKARAVFPPSPLPFFRERLQSDPLPVPVLLRLLNVYGRSNEKYL